MVGPYLARRDFPELGESVGAGRGEQLAVRSGGGATHAVRTASTSLRSPGVTRKNFCAAASPWPPCRETACTRVWARPSWRYGPESRNPHSGGVLHSRRLAPRRARGAPRW